MIAQRTRGRGVHLMNEQERAEGETIYLKDTYIKDMKL
jgi:hypothetical protein